MDRRWIIYLDLDETLLTSRLAVSPRVRRVLRTLPPDVDVVLASGRPAASCTQLAEELLAQSRFVIASNGGTVIDCATGEPVHHLGFSPQTAEKVAALAETWPVALCVYHPTRWYALRQAAPIETRSGSQPIYVTALDEFYAGAIKILMVGDPDVIQCLQRVVSCTEGVTAFVSYPEYLEVMPATVSKATAAQFVESRLRGPAVRRMAIGDGPGDIPLLIAADCSVAVANAVPEVKRAAHYIAPSNDDDGVAVAIDALVHGEPLAMAQLAAGGRSDGDQH